MIVKERLDLSPEPASVTKLNTWLENAFNRHVSAQSVAHDIKLCLHEAVSNVISYGFETPYNNRLWIELTITDDDATALVFDNGLEFNPLNHQMKDRYTDLKSAEIGGFGIRLIRETATEVLYERADGRNILTLVCRVPK